MKYVYPIIILSILSLSGCSTNGAEDDLKIENEKLKQENELLSVVKEELEIDLKILNLESTRKNEKLNNKINSLQATNDNHLEIIDRYQKAFEFPLTNNLTIANSLSIFSPEQVKINSQIAGLIVSDRKEETVNGATSYHVKFTGDFEVKGSIFYGVSGAKEYSFIVKENLEKMPHTLWEFENGRIYFDVINDADLLKSVGDKLDTLPEDGKLDIVAIFKNYSYNNLPESDSLSNGAEFVRLAEEE